MSRLKIATLATLATLYIIGSVLAITYGPSGLGGLGLGVGTLFGFRTLDELEEYRTETNSQPDENAE